MPALPALPALVPFIEGNKVQKQRFSSTDNTPAESLTRVAGEATITTIVNFLLFQTSPRSPNRTNL